MDLISVIIPVYNVEEYLTRCLESVINQTYQNLEIIIVNDGTPDASQDIIDSYQAKDSRIISLIKQNGGLGDARNYGLPYAHGEYVIFIDSDDYIQLDMIEKLHHQAVSSNSEIVMCNHYIKSDTSCHTDPFFKQYGRNLKEDPTALFQKPAVWDKLFKKDVIEGILFKTGIFYEDIGFMCKVLPRVTSMTYVDEPLYYYIIRSNSIMNAKQLERNTDIITAFKDVVDYYKEHKLLNTFKNEIGFMLTDHIMIAGYMRVLQYPNSTRKKEILKQFRQFTISFDRNYLKNPYIKTLSINRKICLYLCHYHLDFLALFLFKRKRR